MRPKKGILQPQLISPAKIRQIVKNERNTFPRDQFFPLAPSSECSFQLLNITDFDAFIQDICLCYGATEPVFPCKLQCISCTYSPRHIAESASIQPEEELTLVDKTRQDYTPLKPKEMGCCMLATSEFRLCRQDFPVQILH